ncbi:TPA: hypothetical protein JAK05_000753 [Corynebacterium striatum]|nr:hypothetical protein [Corynebacterium striatum]EGT5613144.1 hypothetical protein [Corynebacterium striatum]EGT5787638.1 hypothetical protein [Corynebacterium striatum]HAT6524779.1 hypothetical protein [Corynebacterium striatum]HAT6562911.1 hypothetical protein [Corynebacterium striatum]
MSACHHNPRPHTTNHQRIAPRKLLPTPSRTSGHICANRTPVGLKDDGPDPRKVDTSGVSYAAWVSVADVSASKSLGARKLHQECCLRVL